MASPAVYAFIPARGGSRRVKKKNLAYLQGKPLFAHAVKVARNSGLFQKIYVNSEDAEILAVAALLKAEPYRRPQDLAGDQVFIIEVLKEMVRTLRLADTAVLGIMLPTCPLRTVADVQGAYRLFQEAGSNTPVVSVAAFDIPIQLAHFIKADGRLDPVFPRDYRQSTRSTDHQTAYYYNEAIIFNTVGNLLKQTNLIGKRPLPYIMPAERSHLIDYGHQMEIVRLLMSGK